jgi:hypothetical protein
MVPYETQFLFLLGFFFQREVLFNINRTVVPSGFSQVLKERCGAEKGDGIHSQLSRQASYQA